MYSSIGFVNPEDVSEDLEGRLSFKFISQEFKWKLLSLIDLIVVDGDWNKHHIFDLLGVPHE
jgi:hypothetical protein